MRAISLFLIIILFNSCAVFVDEYQSNQRKVIDYLLSDLPLPDDSNILKEPTVILGTGSSVSARVVLNSSYSPAENLIFYGNQTPTTGWVLASSKVGKEIVLVYSKEGRYALIDILPSSSLGSFFGGSGSEVIISIVHPDAIGSQNPYGELNYDNLPESP